MFDAKSINRSVTIPFAFELVLQCSCKVSHILCRSGCTAIFMHGMRQLVTLGQPPSKETRLAHVEIKTLQTPKKKILQFIVNIQV